MPSGRSCVAALSLLGLACACGLLAPAELEAQRGPLGPGAERVAQARKPGRRILPQGNASDSSARTTKGARATDANGQLLRLMQMSPERRKAFFETNPRFLRLPESRRNQIRRRLNELDRLPAEQKEILVARYQLFNQLPSESQAAARETYEEWRKMERDRRNQVMVAVRRLRPVRRERRELLLQSERFRSSYNDDERAMIKRLLDLAPNHADRVRD